MSLNRLFLASLLILAGVSSAVAQNSQDDDLIRKAVERALTGQQPDSQEVSLSIPAKRKFSHKAKITTEYDKFSDETTIGTDYMRRVYQGRDHYLALRAYFSYSGASTPSRPPRYVHLVLASESSRWQYLDPPSLILLTDGERLNLGVMERADSETRYIRGVGVSVFEYLDVAVPTATFLQIVNASQVEAQVGGDVEFTLKSEHLEALRDLASRMRP